MEPAHRRWRIQRHHACQRLTTVGVFDSGVGGLSVLHALQAELPDTRFIYLADSAFAPYGERPPEAVQERCHLLTNHLRQRFDIDALVVACNTATAMAIDELRRVHADLPIVGVEPALKSAALTSRTGHIGVIGTRRTMESTRFAALRARVEAAHPGTAVPLAFNCLACDGLADTIERADLALTRQLCQRYMRVLQRQAPAAALMDTLVLGCTHYPFAANELRDCLDEQVQLVETGLPVARRTRDVLGLANSSRPAVPAPMKPATYLTTGQPDALNDAVRRWLGTEAEASGIGHTLP